MAAMGEHALMAGRLAKVYTLQPMTQPQMTTSPNPTPPETKAAKFPCVSASAAPANATSTARIRRPVSRSPRKAPATSSIDGLAATISEARPAGMKRKP